MKIADIKIGKRHRKELGDIEALIASVGRVGLLHPVVVTTDDTLVAGMRRVRACEALGWKEIEVTVIDPSAMLQAEHDENVCRLDFTKSERVAIAKELHAEMKRQGKRPELVGNCPQVDPGEKSRDRAAKAAGFKSTDEFRRAAKVVDKGIPELVEAMDKGEVSAGAAADVADLPADEQKAAVKDKAVKAKAKAGRMAKAKAAEKPPPAPDDASLPPDPDGAGIVTSAATAAECRGAVTQMHRVLSKFQEHLSGLMSNEAFALPIRNTAEAYNCKIWHDGTIIGGKSWGSVSYGIAKYHCDALDKLFGLVGGLKLLFDHAAIELAKTAGDDIDARELGESLRDAESDIDF